MLIIALDYEYAPSSELTCTRDARTMYRMAGRAGVDDITIITDKDWLEIQAFQRGPLCCDTSDKWPEVVKLAIGLFGFGQAME
eukprot:Skav209763  [mRNA]  locus=scaffold9:291932:292386:+ [translate_table: standard]